MSKFSTLNESSLHNTLKLYYSTQFSGKIEVELNGFIYDILTDKNEAIEIQTRNLSKLHDKIQKTLESGIKVRLVYPLVMCTRIITTDNEGKLISSRKSPKKGSIYDILKEVTGIYDLLLKKNFCLEVISVNVIEHRVQTEEPVQSKNKKRRFKKDWIKVNKRLEDIINIKDFKSKKDWLSLLPTSLSEEFCAKDIKEILKENKLTPAKIYNNPNLFTWLFFKMDLIEYTETKVRSKYYKIKK